MIVRAHEVMNEGYLEYYFGREDRQHPQVIFFSFLFFSFLCLFFSLFTNFIFKSHKTRL